MILEQFPGSDFSQASNHDIHEVIMMSMEQAFQRLRGRIPEATQLFTSLLSYINARHEPQIANVLERDRIILNYLSFVLRLAVLFRYWESLPEAPHKLASSFEVLRCTAIDSSVPLRLSRISAQLQVEWQVGERSATASCHEQQIC
jgi:hypothetical protein